MNKAELVEKVAVKLNCSKKAAEKAVGAVIETIREGVIKEGEVRLIGFGTFRVVERAERTGVNPKTGKKIKIPAKKAVKFVPSKRFGVE
jgi:DNA-binding protein HU-beta